MPVALLLSSTDLQHHGLSLEELQLLPVLDALEGQSLQGNLGGTRRGEVYGVYVRGSGGRRERGTSHKAV